MEDADHIVKTVQKRTTKSWKFFKVSNILTMDTVLLINLDIDDDAADSHTHTHVSYYTDTPEECFKS
jgi:hypothetical protein